MKETFIKDFDILSQQEKDEAFALINRYEQIDTQDACRQDFMQFI